MPRRAKGDLCARSVSHRPCGLSEPMDHADELRVGAQLEIRTWCGLRPNARQIAEMAVRDMQVAATIDRVDQ